MRILTSFYKILGTKLLSLFILLVSRVLTARILGPADLGSIGNALNFITIISRWGSLGPATQYTSSKYSAQRNLILVYAFAASIFMGMVNILFLTFFRNEIFEWLFASDNIAQLSFSTFVPFLPVIILSMTLPIHLLGANKLTAYSATQVLPLVIQTIIIAISFYQNKSLSSVIIAQCIFWVVVVCISFFFFDTKNFQFQFDRKLLVVYARYALKSWPQVMIQFGIARFAILIGGQNMESKSMGLYILASNLSESFLILNSSITPIIFNKTAANGSDISFLAQSLRLSNLSFAVIFGIILIIGKPIFLFFFGLEFDQSWTLFLLLLLSILFQSMIRICLNYMAGLGKNALTSGIQLIELFALLISSFLVFSSFGAIGLCYSSILAALTGFICCLIALKNIEKQTTSPISMLIPNRQDFEVLKKILFSWINVNRH